MGDRTPDPGPSDESGRQKQPSENNPEHKGGNGVEKGERDPRRSPHENPRREAL